MWGTIAILALVCAPVFAFGDDAALEALLAGGLYPDAVTLAVEQAEGASSGDQRAYWALRAGQVYALYLHLYEQAEAMFTRCIQALPGSPMAGQAAYFLGRLAYERGDGARAAHWFREAVRDDPNGPRAHNARFLLGLAEQLALQGQTKMPEPPAVPTRPLRVLVLAGQRRVTATAESTVQVLDAGDRVVAQGARIAISALEGHVALEGRKTDFKEVWLVASGGLRCNDRGFSGRLRVMASGDRLDVVEVVDVETYLRGVLPREMPVSWPVDALKAQAVASRTYALYQAAHRMEHPFDVQATEMSQVYGGADARHPNADRAIRETAGEVLMYHGRLALTFFHAHSGGMTADDNEVWRTNLPYLKARPDPFGDGAPAQVVRWQVVLSRTEVAQALGFVPVTWERGGSSGRMQRAVSGGRQVSAHRFRMAAGSHKVRSTLFEVRQAGDGFIFEGRGFGHGVGMSQWGARGMALQGKTYRDILSHYYTGTHIQKASEGGR